MWGRGQKNKPESSDDGPGSGVVDVEDVVAAAGEEPAAVGGGRAARDVAVVALVDGREGLAARQVPRAQRAVEVRGGEERAAGDGREVETRAVADHRLHARAARGVPHAHGLVLAARDDAARRADERAAEHLALVPRERVPQARARHAPQARGLVVRAPEHEVVRDRHARVVHALRRARQRRRRRPRPRVPQPHRLVLRARHQHRPVHVVRQRAHVRPVPRQRRAHLRRHRHRRRHRARQHVLRHGARLRRRRRRRVALREPRQEPRRLPLALLRLAWRLLRARRRRCCCCCCCRRRCCCCRCRDGRVLLLLELGHQLRLLVHKLQPPLLHLCSDSSFVFVKG